MGNQKEEVTSELQFEALFPGECWELGLLVFRLGEGVFTMEVSHKEAKWDSLGYSGFLPPHSLCLLCPALGCWEISHPLLTS